jgi:hypothetical protein
MPALEATALEDGSVEIRVEKGTVLLTGGNKTVETLGRLLLSLSLERGK